MKKYEIVEGYNLFKQLNVDLIGTNHRAGKIVDGKVTEHFLFTEIYPFLYKDEEAWKRIELLLNGVKKSKISNLYSPEIVINSDKKYLVYPYLDAVSLESIVDDSIKKNIPINFDLALSISMGVADLLDAGSSIAVSGKRSFHGFLTPDNIVLDHDGNIWIKNYGVYAYLNSTDEIHKEFEMKYGPWVTPEFLKKEKPLPQSDIYHLGYLIYKMVTGNYFSHSEGENFESKLSNISFLHHIPATDKEFLNNIILFFKKTLNPDPAKRFSSIREFKEFISDYFKIEELSSVTFNIAYFMSSMYSDDRETSEKVMAEELKYIIPSKVKEMNSTDNSSKNSDIVENLLSGLDDKDKSSSKSKLMLFIAAIVIIAVAIGIYTTLGGKKEVKADPVVDKAEQVQKAQQEIENAKLKEQNRLLLQDIADRKKKEKETLKAIADNQEKIKKAETEKEKARLKEQNNLLKEKMKKEKEDLANKEAEAAKIEEAKKQEDEKKKLEEQKKEGARLKLEAAKKALKEGDLVIDVDQKPVGINTDVPELSRKLRKKIKGESVRAVVSALVDEKGNVKRIKIPTKTGVSEIDMELTRIIYSWKFKPALKYNKKVKTWFTKVVIIKK